MKPVADLDTTLRQRRASDPAASAWVSANAGSGKTKVLVDRVLRLLLAGAPPSRILCLTFTKAAAANMAVRVFDSLGKWVTLPDDALISDLTELEGQAPSARKLKRARRLFADAIETPGGLKIETIHAFCERVLHIAPFEANVPASFEVLDDLGSAGILEEARRLVLGEAASGADAALSDALTQIALQTSDDGLDKALRAALEHRDLLRRAARDPAVLPDMLEKARAALGLRPDETPDAIDDEIVSGGLLHDGWDEVCAMLERSTKKTDIDVAESLRACASVADPGARARAHEAVFHTDKGMPRADTFITKQVDPATAAALRDERDRVALLVQKRNAALILARSRALLTLAAAMFARVELLKRQRGALDFKDLIEKTAALMRRDAAAWVLEKLDAGIDHLLVDEAQDTAPEQWAILEAITAEFSAGFGRRGEAERPRTIFAVGDPKQSIYGFQGARPRLFEETGRRLARAVTNAQGRFEKVELRRSFRSGPAVLTAVDNVFAVPAHFRGLSFDDLVTRTEHESAREKAPGDVQVWPVVRPSDKTDPDAWKLPLDEPDAGEPPVRNAARIAGVVRQWIDAGVPAGEILILARKRGPAFDATIRALKSADVPVAGADRLTLSTHIAVMDLVAVGLAALQPQDDLTLATVLKSPIVGWSDDDLIRIAGHRPEGMSLAEAISLATSSGDVSALSAQAALERWREAAFRLGPFAFYASLLGPQGARGQLVARLGPEAADAIDTFLSRAFAHERAGTPSLLAFLDELTVTEESVKRELDAQSNEVRVMTVHGAKGLEASAVILIDGCDPASVGKDVPLFVVDLGGRAALPLWAGKKDHDPPLIAAARQAVEQEAEHEHNRLLYVALTRAKDRLAIAPHMGRNRKEPPDLCWSRMALSGLQGGLHAQTIEDEALGGAVLSWRIVADAIAPAEPARLRAAPAKPAWFHAPVALDIEPLPPLRPSATGAADRTARAGDGPLDRDARLLGTVVHALLQYLPDVERPRRADAATAFADIRLRSLPQDRRQQAVRDALAVLDHSDLSVLFGPFSRAEAPIAGRLTLGDRIVDVSGQIDRLAVTPDAVVLADFKTTSRPPSSPQALPQAHVAQVAVYWALMRAAFPGRPCRVHLVYTAGGLVIPVPEAAMVSALSAMSGSLGSPAPTGT